MSWLGHSVGTGPQVSAVEEIRREEDQRLLVAKQLETKELESFRYIHLVIDGSDRRSSLSVAVERQTEAQLYLRNIVDRYPHMPSYLAHRLAIANASRAERLRRLLLDHERVLDPLPSTVQDIETKIPQGKDGTSGNTHFDMPNHESLDHQHPSRVVWKDDISKHRRTVKSEDINSARYYKERYIWECYLEQRREYFDEHDEPTYRLGKLLRQLASRLIEELEPWGCPVLTPQNMQQFYQKFKLPVETYDWQMIFDDEITFISRLYQDLGCQHHLIQGDEDYCHSLSERPGIPALTPLGFERWVTLLIRAYPIEESSRLHGILSDTLILNPETKQDLFPRVIDRRNAPQSPCYFARDSLQKAVLKNCLELQFSPDSDYVKGNLETRCSSSHVHRPLSSAMHDAYERYVYGRTQQIPNEAIRQVRTPSRERSWSPRPKSRTSSVNSRTSSWNSTLHGSSEFDPSEQVLEFNEGETPPCEMADIDIVSQPLDFEIPHPPKELGSTPFICEICGKQVSIEGRRAWK